MPYCSGLCLTNLGLLVGSYNLLSPLFCQRLMDIASKIGPFRGKMHQKRTFAKVLGQNQIAIPGGHDLPPTHSLAWPAGFAKVSHPNLISKQFWNNASVFQSGHPCQVNVGRAISLAILSLPSNWPEPATAKKSEAVHHTWRPQNLSVTSQYKFYVS